MNEEHSQGQAADASQREREREQEKIQLQGRMVQITRKLLVLSGKGGVGKSTVAANLAMALAMAGKKVGLLDVDLHGPSIPKILGLEGRRLGPDTSGAIAPIQLKENLAVVSIGLLLTSEKDAVIWRGPLKYKVIQQFLKDVAWGKLDFLIIDSPPGTGDEPLSVAQLVGEGAAAVVVSTPQDVAVADVRRSISFCNTLNLPVAGVIENMSGLICPHCGERIDLFKTGGAEKLAAEMGVPFLGSIPLDPEIVTSGDSGKPFVDAFPGSETAKAFSTAIQPLLS
ncbi:MAG: Mrp/NBP35 family ATP-binding protein [Candidatus Hydrogenedentes bacterium]|nr:Mrp/NBP35 family ATP-binding protein [Candidatus Hydrogenedentota bacterium]